MAKARQKKWQERLTGILELPQDVLFDLPRLILLGNQQLIIENHRGVIEYEPGRIRVNTPNGELRIAGTGLGIAAIWREELIIVGQISRIEYRQP